MVRDIGRDSVFEDEDGDGTYEQTEGDGIAPPSVDTENLSSERIIGPSGFDSLQAAHDDLPASGGVLKLRKSISETDIQITKPVVIEGKGGSPAPVNNTRPETIIDVSGGDGVWLRHQCTMRDVAIEGDGTGAYELRIGESGVFNPGFYVENVTTNGGSAVQIRGAIQQSHFHFADLRNSQTHGIHVDVSQHADDYFNANTVLVDHAGSGGGDGVHVTGSPVNGNEWRNLTLENMDEWGFYVEDGVEYEGNIHTGYGSEKCTAGGFYINNIVGDGTNTLEVRRADNGNTVNNSAFTTLSITKRPNHIGSTSPELSNYLHDDFADSPPNLENRRGTRTGKYPDPSIGPSGQYAGVYRPRWVTLSGSPSISGGALQLPAGDATAQRVQTPGRLDTGTFEFTLSAESAPSSGAAGYRFLYDNTNDEYWLLQVQGDGDVVLSKKIGGTFTGGIIAGTWGADTGTYTFEVTRDGSGNLELFVDGTSQGTATDTDFPTDPTQIQVANEMDVAINVAETRQY